jgi:hypothetical protein
MTTKRVATPTTHARDALVLLKEDHRKVKKLFKDYARLVKSEGDGSQKAALVEDICLELKVHTRIEEEIFYPAVREAIEDEDLMDEAIVEHASAKDLIAQLEGMDPGDDYYDAKVTVLGEYINHHVEEEEEEMFPKVKKSDLDTKGVGMQLMQLKEDLMENPDRLKERKGRLRQSAG